jgi:hypothetical protein
MGVLDTFAGEFEAVGFAELVFVFAGAPQAIAKAAIQTTSSAFLMADVLLSF